jgi:AraC-like DNA-binding protein
MAFRQVQYDTRQVLNVPGGAGMPLCSVRHVTDVEEFRAAIRPANSIFVVTGRGSFSADITRIRLHRLQIQRISETLARAWHIEMHDTSLGIGFRGGPGAAIKREGVELRSDELGLIYPGNAAWVSRCGPGQLATMSFPLDDLAELGIALVGRDLTHPRGVTTARAAPAQIARLRSLHVAATQMAETAPEIIANPDAARGLEASLIDATIACLASGSPLADTPSHRRHAKIMKRFLEVTEACHGHAVYVTEVCAALGVTQRTLHVVCQEQLGIGPKRYLLLRRLHLAHQALLAETPERTTVTDIATRYGFWELGRFAGSYRSVFGEAPSVTLHGVPGDERPRRALAVRHGATRRSPMAEALPPLGFNFRADSETA